VSWGIQPQPVIAQHAHRRRQDQLHVRPGATVITAHLMLERTGESLVIHRPERHAQRAQLVGHRREVPVHERPQQQHQVQPLGHGQLADHAAVQEGHHPGVEADVQVARVRVGVKEAVDQQHLDRRAEGGLPDLRHVKTGPAHRLDLRDLHPGDELLGQHPAARQRPVQRRDMHALDRLHVPGQGQHVVRLAVVVQLLQQRAAELLQHRPQPDLPCPGAAALAVAAHQPGYPQVRVHLAVQVGPLHLDGHLGAIARVTA